MLDENLQLLLDEATESMDRALQHLRHELNTIRAGRATPAMLEGVRAEYYGVMTPLNQMANINAPQADLIVVQPWERKVLNVIERAIIAANLGFNPSNDGNVIRIPVPTPTEERRRDLVKMSKHKGEEAKIAIRNIRRSAKDEMAAAVKEFRLPEDMGYDVEDRLQKVTDKHIHQVDDVLVRKEAEIMEV